MSCQPIPGGLQAYKCLMSCRCSRRQIWGCCSAVVLCNISAVQRQRAERRHTCTGLASRCEKNRIFAEHSFGASLFARRISFRNPPRKSFGSWRCLGVKVQLRTYYSSTCRHVDWLRYINTSGYRYGALGCKHSERNPQETSSQAGNVPCTSTYSAATIHSTVQNVVRSCGVNA